MELIKRHKKIFISLILVVSVLLAIISIDKKYKPSFINNIIGFVITPFQSGLTSTGNWFGEKIDFVVNMAEMENENTSLKKELEEISAENSRLKSINTENENLTKLLEMTRKYSSYPMVGANVIAKDPGSWYDTFVIDKGSKDGLKKDMVILASGGLVGRIYEVGYNYSKIRSIIDDTSSVSAKSERTNDIGYLRGDSYLMLNGQARMGFIDAQSEMLEGEEIVTSHLSEIYPPGIIIGKILEIKADYTGTKYAIIEPFVDFKHLESVLVITQVFEKNLIDNPIAKSEDK